LGQIKVSRTDPGDTPTMDAASVPAPASPGPATAPPGDLAIWFFILAELLAFGVFFAAYAFARAHNVALFDTMQQTLDRQAGALNTVLLISGSACVARAVEAVGRARSATGARWLLAGIACGAGFLVVKGVEYAAKFEAGINLSTPTSTFPFYQIPFYPPATRWRSSSTPGRTACRC
jgi:nitric oxide reductase NorE protein